MLSDWQLSNEGSYTVRINYLLRPVSAAGYHDVVLA